ncbi:hypothetical protein [Bythopirellula polymerisocia]|uniref:Uncharacterized protein n=1 Tax=Bythopirellula polymerisocia TaxID=2528003 RepID=A0A5C6CZJ7_9BACT|nr:hypothetical protein [Bythopirellula polymerisocia]TWU29858.1 hypothetical protein Pla144_06380 [Bythopirellula polymerisocia]
MMEMGGWGRLAPQFRDDGVHTSQPIRSAWMRSIRFGYRTTALALHPRKLGGLVCFHRCLLFGVRWRVLFFRFLQIQLSDPATVLLQVGDMGSLA